MSKLKNVINIKPIPIDGRILKYIKIIPTVEINDRIRNLFGLATQLLADQLEKDKIEKHQCNCVFTDSDETTIVLDAKEYGHSIHLCIFPVYKWNECTNTHILTFLLEEFAHYFWSIEDEYEVCFKVLELASGFIKDATIEKLYKKEWLDYKKLISNKKE